MIQISKNFNKVDLEAHSHALKSYDYDELTYDLMQLEIEYYELQPHMVKKEIQLYRKLIKLYETEKALRLKNAKINATTQNSVGNAMMGWLDEGF